MSTPTTRLNGNQCPMCFQDLEPDSLMDESRWEGMSIPARVNLCKALGLEGKVGSRSYDKLTDENCLALLDMVCPNCGTQWPIEELVEATTTPHQLEIYEREKS